MPTHSRSLSLHGARGDPKKKGTVGVKGDTSTRASKPSLSIPQPVADASPERSPNRGIPQPSRLPRLGSPRKATAGESLTRTRGEGEAEDGSRSIAYRPQLSPARKAVRLEDEPSGEELVLLDPAQEEASSEPPPADTSVQDTAARPRRQDDAARDPSGPGLDGDSMPPPPTTKSLANALPKRTQSLRAPASRSTASDRARPVKSQFPDIPSGKKKPAASASPTTEVSTSATSRPTRPSQTMSRSTKPEGRVVSGDHKSKRESDVTPKDRSSRHSRSTSQGSILSKVAGDPPKDTASVPARAARDKPPATKKPAFSTLQQHFSPKKPSKLPSHQALPSRTATKQIAADGNDWDGLRTQVELLQLHLLHSASAQTNKEWTESAKCKIKQRFEQVARAHREVKGREEAEQAERNLRAVKTWADEDPRGFALDDKVAGLSAPLLGVLALTDTHGPHATMQEDFTEWIVHVKHVWASRESGVVHDQDEMLFVEGLGDDWEAQIDASVRKLMTYQRELRPLGAAEPGSNLHQVLSNVQILVDDMLAELKLLRTIHRSVLESEQLWAKKALSSVLAEKSDEGEGWEEIRARHGSRRGAWQA